MTSFRPAPIFSLQNLHLCDIFVPHTLLTTCLFWQSDACKVGHLTLHLDRHPTSSRGPQSVTRVATLTSHFVYQLSQHWVARCNKLQLCGIHTTWETTFFWASSSSLSLSPAYLWVDGRFSEMSSFTIFNSPVTFNENTGRSMSSGAMDAQAPRLQQVEQCSLSASCHASGKADVGLWISECSNLQKPHWGKTMKDNFAEGTEMNWNYANKLLVSSRVCLSNSSVAAGPVKPLCWTLERSPCNSLMFSQTWLLNTFGGIESYLHWRKHSITATFAWTIMHLSICPWWQLLSPRFFSPAPVPRIAPNRLIEEVAFPSLSVGEPWPCPGEFQQTFTQTEKPHQIQRWQGEFVDLLCGVRYLQLLQPLHIKLTVHYFLTGMMNLHFGPCVVFLVGAVHGPRLSRNKSTCCSGCRWSRNFSKYPWHVQSWRRQVFRLERGDPRCCPRRQNLFPKPAHSQKKISVKKGRGTLTPMSFKWVSTHQACFRGMVARPSYLSIIAVEPGCSKIRSSRKRDLEGGDSTKLGTSTLGDDRLDTQAWHLFATDSTSLALVTLGLTRTDQSKSQQR